MFQFFGVAASVGVSFTRAAIGFPVIMIALIPLRWVVLPRIFTEEELLILDAPTAEADVVLASIGGRPELPEVKLAEARRRARGGEGQEGVSSGSSSGEGMRSRAAFKDEEEREIEGEKEREESREGVKSTSRTGHV
jgi:boron transporter